MNVQDSHVENTSGAPECTSKMSKVQGKQSVPNVGWAGLARKRDMSMWGSHVQTVMKNMDTTIKKEVEGMSNVTAIMFKNEEVIRVRLPFYDHRIVDTCEVQVNAKICAKFAHMSWCVSPPRIVANATGPTARLSGMYVQTRFPIDRPAYLHLLAWEFYMGEASLEGKQCDHIRPPLHCQIQALREASLSENRQACSGSSTACVPCKGVWLHQNGSYVVEYQFPQRKDVKVTKQKRGMTRAMASQLFNRVSKHFPPDFAYQNPMDEELTGPQEKVVEVMFHGMVSKIESKLKTSAALCDGATSSDTDSTASTPPSKKQRLE